MKKSVRLSALLLGGVILVTSACDPERAAPDLAATYNARQCIIDEESRTSGLYVAENPQSSAAGAYQWIDGSWQTYLPWAEDYYDLTLTSAEEDAAGAREHASYANPFTQDLVTAYALVKRPQGHRPWTYPWCYQLIGSELELREDGPINPPPEFIQAQIDAYIASKREVPGFVS